MKKIQVLLLFTMLLYSTIAIGQVRTFEIGIEGGISSVSLRGNTFVNKNKSDIREVFGGYLKYNLTKNWSFRIGVLKEQKGDESVFSVVNGGNDEVLDIPVNTYFDYLTIPILTQFAVGNKVKGFVNIGPYFGYLKKQTLEYDPSIFYTSGLIEDHTADFRRQDWGITLGLGGGIQILNNLQLTLELRHNKGLTNISNIPVIGDGKIQTNSTNVLLGMSFTLDK